MITAINFFNIPHNFLCGFSTKFTASTGKAILSRVPWKDKQLNIFLCTCLENAIRMSMNNNWATSLEYSINFRYECTEYIVLVRIRNEWMCLLKIIYFYYSLIIIQIIFIYIRYLLSQVKRKEGTKQINKQQIQMYSLNNAEKFPKAWKRDKSFWVMFEFSCGMCVNIDVNF